MSTRTADPQAALADAGHDLLTALAQLVDRHPDLRVAPGAVGELLDELTGLLRRTRGRAARAKKADPASPAEAKPAMPAMPSAPVVVAASKAAEPGAAVMTPPARVAPPVMPTVAVAPLPASPPAAAVSPARRGSPRWVLFGAAVLLFVVLLVLLAGCGGDGGTGEAPRRDEHHLVVVALTSQRAQLRPQVLDVPAGVAAGGDHRRGDQPGTPPPVQRRSADTHSTGSLGGRHQSIAHGQDNCARLGAI